MAIQLRLRFSQLLKPYELQKRIPNHESSFCWIYLPLLTLSIIRSSCPPSHHWTSQVFHFSGLNPISLVGLSRWPGEGMYPKHINWLPVAACIKFKTLMLAYRTAIGSAPAFHSLMTICIPSRSLRSTSERRLVVPSQRSSKSLSRTFSFTTPGWWNDLPIPIRNAGSLQATTENSSLSTLLDFILNKIKIKKLSFSLFIPSLAKGFEYVLFIYEE